LLLNTARGEVPAAVQAEVPKAVDAPQADAPQADTPMEIDAGGLSGEKSVTIAGQAFTNRNAVQTHVRTLQESLSDNKALANEDALFMFHLSSFLPEFESKLIAPVVGFKYGPFNEASVLKCFFMLRSDGTTESISVKKCLDALYATFSPKVPAGTKRAREAEGPAGPEQKKAFKMRPGCVVLISGIPASVEYKALREKLNSMGEEGDCRFVELLESKPKKKKKGKGKGKDKAGKGKADEESDDEESEDDGTPALPNSARARFGEADVAAKVAKELKEINGHPVTARMLQGDEEKEFWEQLLERADKRRGEEASGKKGKGKGKKR